MELSNKALLVTSSVNQRYISRQRFGSSVTLVTAGGSYWLYWVARGVPVMPEGVTGIKTDLSQLGAQVAQLMGDAAVLSVEPDVPLNVYAEISKHVPAEKIVIETCPLIKERDIKTKWELEQLRTACKITDEAFAAVLGKIRVGMTELELAAELEKEMRVRGMENSNKTIVAAGPNSALPHNSPGSYVLQKGDFITMDYGCTVNGYHSDLTRTVVLGKASDKQKHVYETVLKAQLAGVEALIAGKTGGELDAVSRKIIDDAGYEGTFIHNLGHGIGLDIHEGTGLTRGSQGILKPGMVVSIEPGIYIPGFGGVRIEDLAIVREDGCELIEHSSKELIEL